MCFNYIPSQEDSDSSSSLMLCRSRPLLCYNPSLETISKRFKMVAFESDGCNIKVNCHAETLIYMRRVQEFTSIINLKRLSSVIYS